MTSLLADKKRKIRQNLYATLRELNLENRIAWDEKIQNALLESDYFKSSKSIALYFPLLEEVGTVHLFQQSLLLTKKIAFPKVCQGSGLLEFYWINQLEDLQSSFWNLKEPTGEHLEKASPEKIDLMLVPGLAFDRQKNRLGRGKGFYDRVLKKFKGHKISLAYSCQLLGPLPLEPWDEKVDAILTENEWIT